MPNDQDNLAEELGVAVERLIEVFSAKSVNYALIGGLATLLRGRPRFTQDVDILLDVPQLALPPLLESLAAAGFAFERDKLLREYVREHVTSLRFGPVRIDWLKPVLPLYAHTLALIRAHTRRRLFVALERQPFHPGGDSRRTNPDENGCLLIAGSGRY